MIAVFHIEKSGIIRDALCSILTDDISICWGGCGDKISDLAKRDAELHIDVLIIDRDTCPDCVAVCKTLKGFYPGLKIILNSSFADVWWIEKFMEAGVTGFVSKNSSIEELVIAIREVYAGNIYKCPEIANMSDDSLFTPREYEILELLSKGYSSKAIAGKLFITEKTVESHRKNMITKARVKNIAELMGFVTEHGLLLL